MKNIVAALILLMALPVSGRSENVSWRDIGTSVKIIGRLGVPMGTVVKIKATLISGAELPSARFDFRLGHLRFLRVESVDGKPCEDRPVMHFQEDYLPDAVDSEGKTIGRKPLMESATGTTFILLAYESGGTGVEPETVPENSFGYVQGMAEPDAKANPHFLTRLTVKYPAEQSGQLPGTARP
jgi:hypothetical protein